MADKLKMTTQRFNSRCGKNISFSDNNTVAERVRTIDNGIVFAEQPLALGTVFQVKILKYDAMDSAQWSDSGSIVSG